MALTDGSLMEYMLLARLIEVSEDSRRVGDASRNGGSLLEGLLGVLRIM